MVKYVRIDLSEQQQKKLLEKLKEQRKRLKKGREYGWREFILDLAGVR